MIELRHSPLHTVGSLICSVSAIVSFALGFTEIRFIASVMIGGLLLIIGYILVRLPQIIGDCEVQGIKNTVVILIVQLPMSFFLAAILWGVGKGISIAFN